MSGFQKLGSSAIPADLVARDRDGKVVLLVEVKAPKSEYITEHPDSSLVKWARDHPEPEDFPYLMVANVNTISIFKRESASPSSDIYSRPAADFSFKSDDFLTAYDPLYRQKADVGRILEYYLEGLIVAWLRDLTYHWKFEEPPGTKELARIGLASRLEGGWVEEEDPDDDPLC